MIRHLLKLRRRRQLEQDLEAELAFHREMAEASGNPIPLGNTSVLKEQAFDLWRFNTIENLWRDIVYAFRALRKSPAFVLAALLSLGLGIGVNTAMFSLAVEFLLSEPSVRDAASLVHLREGGNSHVTAPAWEEIRRSGIFEDVAGENEETFINFNDGSETRRIFAVQTTKNFFTTVGVPMGIGRGYTEQDANEVVVLHPYFWRNRLGADPAIVGKSIRLDNRLYTVIGVLPDDYRSLVGYGFSPDVIVPKYLDDTIFVIYARLKPGMSQGQASAALPALTERLKKLFPSRYQSDRQLNAAPVAGVARLQREQGSMTVALFFGILLLAVGLVLLIACVNVAGLLLARTSVRRQEIAIRLSLGASRGRLLQQLLAESLLLSCAGACIGFFLALVVSRAIAAIPLPLPVPVRLHIDPDWRVVTYAACLAILATVASGLMPALQSLKDSLTSALHRERKLRMRRILVVAQIAVSFVVLTTAALFLNNLVHTRSLGPGFDIQNTVRAEVYLPPSAYKESQSIHAYVRRSLEELKAIPGIDSAAAARIIPFTDATTYGTDLTFLGESAKKHATFNWNAVTSDYFRAMQIPIVHGRTFTEKDDGRVPVVIVNEEFVRRYLPNREPEGVTFRWDEGQVYQIVGVVKGTRNMTIGEDPRAQLYEPLGQLKNMRSRLQFVVRSQTPPANQVTAVQQALRKMEPGAGLEVQTMFSAIGFAFLPSQVGAMLMGSIGALGLLLAAIGLYGVLAYSITSRSREIGIRIAVGARPSDVSLMVLREFGRLLLPGLVLGLGIALLVTRPLSMFLVPGLSASDPLSFVAVILVLTATGIAATIGPVLRAVRVDPMQSLRYE